MSSPLLRDHLNVYAHIYKHRNLNKLVHYNNDYLDLINFFTKSTVMVKHRSSSHLKPFLDWNFHTFYLSMAPWHSVKILQES